MVPPADLVLRNGRVHALSTDDPRASSAEPDATALAIRDGDIVAVGSPGAMPPSDQVIDLEDRVVLPGFIDAHTHLEHAGLSLVHADLSTATSRADALDTLATHASNDADTEWIVGVGYDESTWPGGEQPTRRDLDGISTDRPVGVLRVDMHTAVLNSVALDRFGNDIEDDHLDVDGSEPTGRVVEGGLGVISPVADPDRAQTRRLLAAAIERAHRLGITGVHEKVRHSHAPEVYRDMDLAGELGLRVRIDYWRHHLDAVLETGLRTNHGSAFVRTGAIKMFTDGSIGARTAKLSRPYADDPGRGQWVLDPAEFESIARRAAGAGLQLSVHAIGDDAIDRAIAVLSDVPGSRHRIEHAELASDESIAAMAEHGIVASMQPNFHRWAGEDGLYETALGPERTRESNRLGTVHQEGVDLAFGSDCMPMGPLFGIHHAVNAPTPAQSLSVGDALRAYTAGAARAAFDEQRLGTIAVGKQADLVVLDRSPWEAPEEIRDIGVERTIVDGTTVYSV